MTDADILKIRDAELSLARAAFDAQHVQHEKRLKEYETLVADLKQQLHAYKEYHDSRDEYHRVVKEPGAMSRDIRQEIDRVRKANAELQTLRNKGK